MQDFNSSIFCHSNGDIMMSQSIFSVGMTTLHCMGLKDLYSLYNPLANNKKKRFDKVKLGKMLNKV